MKLLLTRTREKDHTAADLLCREKGLQFGSFLVATRYAFTEPAFSFIAGLLN